MRGQIDDMQPQGGQPGDERLFVKFYTGTMQDNEASAREGRPIFKSVPFIKILVPGDRNTVIDTFANKQYQQRFPKQWAAFSNNDSQQIEGTLLSETPLVTRAVVEELEYFKVYTVEQLAECPDNLAAKIPKFHELKRKAQTYVQQAKDSALAVKLGEENDALKSRIGNLEGEIARLSQMFDAAVKNSAAPQEPPRVERSGSRSSRV